MELKREVWSKKDIKEFQDYLKSFENPAKREWCTNILNTKMPVLCMKTDEIMQIVKEIKSGNYLAFLDYMLWDYYENTAINGYLISMIKDFATQKHYLDIYSSLADNWATCDLLIFNVKNNEENYFNLVNEYIKSDKPFVRRIGIYILFEFIDNNNYNDKIFEIVDLFKEETEYYVCVMISWLLCECFIKQREKTLRYLGHHNLNRFTINKTVQKCRESRRVSAEDKEMLKINFYQVK